ncbi:hypothetical protein F444_03853 [Phytophthora nicotianae P1976]|uniref:Peptidase M43 pregnancy-associated plasma-A domain-containing protein n=1 Tax=Phytophthora nicotianae P1976 TaxID=1317066 RepID=A0A081ASL9_PHYNI|nr:hypothetical protein F444_03853 [Phytophthora nicotianae P1976]
MPPIRLSAVVVAASLVTTPLAIDFGGENDVAQTAGTVAPGGETQASSFTPGAGGFENFGDTNQWMQTASSNNVMTTSGSGYQGWSQPATGSPSVWTGDSESQVWNPSGQSSGMGGQSWSPSSGFDDQDNGPPGMDVSLECSGSDEDLFTGSLECSGSDEEETSTPATPSDTSETTPTTAAPSSETSDQSLSPSPPSTSSSDTAVSQAGEYENSAPETTSSLRTKPTTASSSFGEEGDSLQTQFTSTASSSNIPTSSSSTTGQQEELPAAQTSSNTSSSGHATFGTIKSKSGECVVSDPDTYISAEDLTWIWNNRMKSEVEPYNNWIMDHLVANKGTINYCIRWDSSTTKLTKEIAQKLQPMLTRQHAAWNRWLIGYDCWPFDEIKVNIVGFAAKTASDLGWSDSSMGKLYIGDLDKDGAPQCPENCYRSVDGSPGGWSESSGCEGKPFDISLWPKQGLGGGWGTYWGQQVNLDDMLEHLDDDELEIVSHEMGHGFGLPDFYQQPKPDNFKPCLMDAMTSSSVRDTDGWLLRRVLEYKKRNYNF